MVVVKEVRVITTESVGGVWGVVMGVGVVAGIVSQLVVSGQIIGVGMGLMATFSPSSVYSWQAGLLKIDVHPAIVKLFKVVSLATLLSSVS